MSKFSYLLAGKPRFCKECGKPLWLYEKEIEFNQHTGKIKKILVTVECPDFKYKFIGYTSDGQPSFEGNGHSHFGWKESKKN